MAIYHEVPCPACEGRGRVNKFELTKFGGCTWTEDCPNCDGTGSIQVAMTNSQRLASLKTPEDQLKFIRGYHRNAKYAGDPVRLLDEDNSDADLLEWLNKVSDNLDDYIFENR